MILNLNPDPFGLVEEEDIRAYKGFGAAVNLLYEDPVIENKNPKLKVGVETVWRFPEELHVENGSVVIMEDVLRFGQLVAEYQLRVKTSHGWIDCPEQSTTIGHKRIHPFPKALRGETSTAISLKITKLVTDGDSIWLREVSVYDWTRAARKGYV